MDIERPDLAKKKKRRQLSHAIAGVTLFFVVVSALVLYDPGPYRVEKDRIFSGEKAVVKRGSMLRQVRGVGTLIPAEIRWIAARSSGRIETIHILPGTQVTPDDVIMELSNPELLQEKDSVELQLKSDEANFLSFKVDLQSELLQVESNIASLEANYKQAELVAAMDESLFKQGLESELSMSRSKLNVAQLKNQLNLERRRLDFKKQAMASQIQARESQIEQTRARFALLNSQVDGLRVKADVAGVLQRQDVQEGQQITRGQNLAQVANPKSLKARIQIPEYQAKDILAGQAADIDTRDGIVAGKISRVDPNVVEGTVAVDVELIGELPQGARPDLTVEGVIEIENISNTLYVGRPMYARPESDAMIYRFIENSNIAEKIQVRFGKASVNTIEILEGLKEGERIILSDTSEWESFDRIEVF